MRWTSEGGRSSGHVWCMDFAHDSCANGSYFRCFALVDEASRECLALEVVRRDMPNFGSRLRVMTSTLGLLGACLGASQRASEVSASDVAARVRSLAQALQTNGLEVRDRAFRERLARGITALNAIPQSTFKRVGGAIREAEIQESTATGLPARLGLETSVVTRLWFLLRYQSPGERKPAIDGYDRFHHLLIDPKSGRSPRRSFDFPWLRVGRRWSLKPFAVIGAAPQSFEDMLKTFGALPLRHGCQ